VFAEDGGPMTVRAYLFILGLAAGLQLAPPNAWAQQAGKVARIGYLSGLTAAADAANIEAFRQGLRALGYDEGRDALIEARHAEGNT
jgi:putative ABC transport system substrate-binding protein